MVNVLALLWTTEASEGWTSDQIDDVCLDLAASARTFLAIVGVKPTDIPGRRELSEQAIAQELVDVPRAFAFLVQVRRASRGLARNEDRAEALDLIARVQSILLGAAFLDRPNVEGCGTSRDARGEAMMRAVQTPKTLH